MAEERKGVNVAEKATTFLRGTSRCHMFHGKRWSIVVASPETDGRHYEQIELVLIGGDGGGDGEKVEERYCGG